MGAIAQGRTRIAHCLQAGDVQSTLQAIQSLSVSVSLQGEELLVEGKGLKGLRAASAPIDMGNSGTTTRLLLGILAGQPFATTLRGDASLSQRPMRRVTEPLGKMGARIEGPFGIDRLPLTIHGGKLRGVETKLPIPSAQVKSALLLAGLYAEGATTVEEPIPTRDHTERMLRYFGASLKQEGSRVTITSQGELSARVLTVPGDLSSAAFFLVGAAILPDSSVTAKGIGLNPTRTGILDLLKQMGASLTVTSPHLPPSEVREARGEEQWEPIGDVTVQSSLLHGIQVTPQMIPRVIDELPILMVAATQADGVTVIEGAGELKVKETDRIHSMVTGLTAMGAKIRSEGETIVMEGPTRLKGAKVHSFGDHRTAMALAIAGLVAQGATTIEESHWIDISFPGFEEALRSIQH